MLLTEEKVNLTRQREFDILKALSIIFMVVVHVYDELSVADAELALCNSPLELIIQFLGGPVCAPIFLFAMGVGLSYSSHRTPKEFMKRGLKLYLFSYLFNMVRFLLPYLISVSFTDVDPLYVIYYIFHVDILTFAGLAFILIGFLKKIHVTPLGVCAIAIAMQGINILLSSYYEFSTYFSYLILCAFVNTCELSYFPLFGWFIYPAFGLLFAKYLRHVKNLDKLYKGLFFISSSLLLVFCATLDFIGYDICNLFALMDNVFYHQTFLHSFFALACIGVEASLIHFIAKVVHLPRLEKAISFLSTNLNNIYIVQWLIIGWLILLVCLKNDVWIPISWAIPLGLLITIVSCFLVKGYQKVFKRKNII